MRRARGMLGGMTKVETGTLHPLQALSGDEIERAAAVVRRERGDGQLLFATITLREPPKEAVFAHEPGDAVDREVDVVVVTGPCSVAEAVVSVTHDELRSWRDVPDARPSMLLGEAFVAIETVRADPRWQEAMRRRGVTDFEKVQIDPWPPGNFDHPAEQGTRISRAVSYLRDDPTDNGYARPIEGVVAIVDLVAQEVVELEDHGLVPIPEDPGRYDAASVGATPRRQASLEITQPDGPGFTVEGNLIRWQTWSLRVSLHPLEGLVLHQLTWHDPDGTDRPVLHRASLSDMVVPYGSTDPAHRWKNAFDAGEWGMGRFVNSLELGCDCLGEIRYLDGVMGGENGDAVTYPNAICLHEEDDGILWKHHDLNADTTEVRRSRRFVVSSIFTVGNYEYAFYWRLYQDGSVELEIRMSGILQTQATANGDAPPQAAMVAPNLAAPHHQHLFCIRLDVCVDGPQNSVVEVDVEPIGDGHGNPLHNGFETVERTLTSELAARRLIDPSRSRTWRIENRGVRNRLGQPVAYRLEPPATQPMLAPERAKVHQRATFATQNLWVTPFAGEERNAAGPYPNQHAGGAGLPEWTAADRPVEDTDIVLWHCFGLTHVARPEDWPVMPKESTGFRLRPVGFFDANPALDVPPPADHC